MSNIAKGLKLALVDMKGEPQKPQGQKVSKQGCLYIHRIGSNYLCEECTMFIPHKERCTIHKADQRIVAKGSCGYFVKGAPHPGMQPMGNFTPAESGYIVPQNGVTCSRCEYYLPNDKDCIVVDKHSTGDDPGAIEPDACCSNWDGK